MALPIYLAMTAWEMAHCPLPEYCGWMACHFSAYSRGLSNIPRQLPENALLILNDRIPPWEHDPGLIAAQLEQAVLDLSPRGVLLDLQRPYNEQTAKIVRSAAALPCPVAVTPAYAGDCDAAVFVPPVPLNKTPREYFSPWQERPIWLEVDCSGLTVTLTKDGCKVHPGETSSDGPGFAEESLLCHYRIQCSDDRAVFSLIRTPEDTERLLLEAEKLGVTLSAGLYQELSPVLFVHDPS